MEGSFLPESGFGGSDAAIIAHGRIDHHNATAWGCVRGECGGVGVGLTNG